MQLPRAVLILTLAVWTLHGQAPDSAADAGAIEGMVVNSQSGEPLKKVQIDLSRTAGASEPVRAVTNSAGKFTLTGLPPGAYRISVSRSGFISPRVQDATREPELLTLQPKQAIEGLVYRLAPASVISGRVVDEDNAPLAGVRIQCLAYAYRRNGRELLPVGFATTDDRGQYRLSGLNPGRYYMQASYTDPSSLLGPVRGAAAEGYPSLYYPGVMDAAQAAEIAIPESEERASIDFKLAPTHVVHVQGLVRNTDSRLAGKDIFVSLAPRLSAGLIGRAPIRVGSDGSFRFDGVTAGSYMVTASAGVGSGNMVRQQLEVGESDLDNVRLYLKPRIDLKGRAQVEGDSEVSLKGLAIFLVPTDDAVVMLGGAGSGSIDAEGNFVFHQIADGDYAVRIDNLPEDSFVKAVRLGDRQAEKGAIHFEASAGSALDLLVSTAGGRLDGSLTDDKQKPAGNVMVVLIPDAARRSRGDLYRSVTSDQYGHFSIRGVPPGDYKLFAWSEDLEAWSWRDPAVLAPYENQGKSVSIDEGSHQAVELQTIPVRP